MNEKEDYSWSQELRDVESRTSRLGGTARSI